MKAPRDINLLLFVCAFALTGLPFAIYLVLLLGSLDWYRETSFLSGKWQLPGGAVEVANVRAAHEGDFYNIIMRFDFTGDLDAVTSGVCVRREYRYEGMQELMPFPQAADWWPAETLQLNLISNDWPMYGCKFESGANYSMTVTPAGRVFMWRTTEP